MEVKIALAGNPISGKTTLFNALTGSNQRVGNWPGVTVEKKEGRLKSDKNIVIQDLPGIYSLSPYTLEEVVARSYLVGEKPDAIINIVDGTNIERNLYLTTQLLELGIPTVVAVNMIDLVRKSGDAIDVKKLSALLGALEVQGALPKTILYCLNPRDTYALCVLAGCFQKEGVKGRVQVGTAWWFLDQPDGMKQNMETQMQVGLIAQSVGMLTDSRSFLSYPRHELYRRLLCNMLGNLVEGGQYPVSELERLGKIVEDICYNNAKNFFGFEV